MIYIQSARCLLAYWDRRGRASYKSEWENSIALQTPVVTRLCLLQSWVMYATVLVWYDVCHCGGCLQDHKLVASWGVTSGELSLYWL